mgnify:CR=1 FL=1
MAKFLTKKMALILLTVVVAASGIIWAIVANIDPKFNSGIKNIPAGLVVSGNGTASVLVDDYLYFVGDSIATSEIKYGDNEYFAHGKMMDAGIYRMKLVDGQPNLTYEYDNTSTNDQGEKIKLQPGDEGYNTKVVGVKDWEDIGKNGCKIEAVVPKIAGHDQTAMWVFGKQLIYVSPHNRYDNRGNLLSDYLDFFRVDLDGKNHTLIYTTECADLTTENFTVWADSADSIYLLVHEVEKDATEGKIKKINVKDKKVTTIDEKVNDVIFPSANYYTQNTNETLDKVYGGVMSYVYYTKAREDNFMGNLLYRYAIKGDEAELLASEGGAEKGTTFKPLAVTPLQNGNAQFVFSAAVKNATTTTGFGLCQINEHNYVDYTYGQPEETWGIKEDANIQIYANSYCTIDSKLYRYTVDGTEMIFDGQSLYDNVEKVLAVYGDVIYIQNGTTVVKVRPTGSTTNIEVVPETVTDDTVTEEGSETETPAHTITLPIAVLYQPHGNTGDPMVFVQDASHIRLYTENGKVNYLKFKQS